MRRRLFWAMVAVAAVTLFIGGVTASILISRSVESERRQEFFRQAEATGQLIQAQLGSDRVTDRNQLDALRTVLRAAIAIGGHDFVELAVVTPRLEIVLPDDAQVIPALPLDVTAIEGSRTFNLDVAGESVLALAKPVTVTEQRRAIVVIGRTADFVDLGAVYGRLALALLVGVALAALLAITLSRSTGKRLDALAAASHAIASGDLSARATVQGSDEVAELAGAFNYMAQELEDAQRRERDFLMSVSHDLRTPLTTIRGYAEGLADDAIHPEDLGRVGGVLHVQADRLSRLIEDLMLLSRLEARQFTLRPERVDIGAHLKEVADGFRARADAARVRLDLDIGDVGVVEIDADRVAQIVANLLENGLRYTPEGGAVSLRLGRNDGGVWFQVSDSGPGIDEADLAHVFERLYVAQRYRPIRPEGSGLGLNIVKELVDAMGGTLSVTSELGKGTAVTVSL